DSSVPLNPSLVMDKTQDLLIVRLVCVVTLIIGASEVTAALTCYMCSEDPHYSNYDPECADYSYKGRTETSDGFNTCYITIFLDEYLHRGGTSSEYDDGDCYNGGSATECYCKGDNCNTDSFCSQCGYPKPTPGTTTTTEATTLTTTKPPSPTTDSTTLTTTNPPPSTADNTITCYQCFDDPASGVYDPDCADYRYDGRTWDGAVVCYIVIYNNGYLQRGPLVDGAGHDDGECYYGSDFTECYCKSAYCNTESYCSQCGYPKPTPDTTTTTEATTLTTTNPPPPTTDNTITCYQCFDDPASGVYDPDCADYSYDGRTWDGADACYIVIYDDGYLRRGPLVDGAGHEDGECYYGSGFTECYCKSAYCNTESYCSQCGYPKPTPDTTTTTEATTLTTTNPPTPTTDDTITCYQCFDDPASGVYDPDCADYIYDGRTWDGADACYIVIYNNGYLRRGPLIDGAGHDDGECYYGSDFTECYCKSAYCNTESYCSQCGYPKPTPPLSPQIHL
ncbi:unnamed protein product, partial [Meganyctiphanes norvegica]